MKTGGKQMVFCNTGHLGSGTWFILREVMGHRQARLYDGSMAAWTTVPGLPVVKTPRG